MISVVIPNYNGENIIKPCLDALLKQTLKPIEVIIIDNASIDKSLEIIRPYGYTIIENRENVGFAKAVNQGIKAAKYDYVFLLNSDVVIEEETLEVLLAEIIKDENVFSIQPKMMQYYAPDLIDDAGDIYTPFGWAFQLGHGLSGKHYNKQRETFSCCAGAALYRKSIFGRIGYFDERFFAYMEDVDLGFRARRFGFINVYTPKTNVFHIGSASFGKEMSSLRAHLSGQNNYLTMRNNMPFGILGWNFPLLIIGFLLKYLKFIRQGFGNDFIKGISNGQKIWRQSNFTTKLKMQDLNLVGVMYLETFKFANWKLRQIFNKGGR